MKNNEKYLVYFLLAAVVALYVMHFTQYSEEVDEKESVDSLVVENEQPKSGKIYYVNTDSVWDQYKFVQEVMAKLEKRKTQFESQIQREFQNFEQEVGEIRQKASMMSQVELEIKQRELVRKESEITKMSEDLEMKFMTEEKEWNDKLRKKIVDYIDESMGDRSYDYVLGYSVQSNIILANDSLDLTEEIIKGLNQEYAQKEQEKEKAK